MWYNIGMAIRSIKPDVNKTIFSWAISRAGFTVDDALKFYPKLTKWESGELYATVKQLKDFSNKFHFPFGYFFLNTIPEDYVSIPLFRSLKENAAYEDFNIRETIKILSERQSWTSDYLKTNGTDINKCVGLYKNKSDILKIKDGILNSLNLKDGWQFSFNSPEQTIKFLVSLLENENIFVTFNSVVNFDNHRPIPVKLCRGFCLVDNYAPFIYVNSNDSKKAQLFTLIHELAHIFISFSSGYGDFGIDEIENKKEKLCDKIAAEFLVPKDLFIKEAINKSNEELSALFKVSEIVILRRKLDCGLITRNSFFTQYDQLPKFHKSNSSGGNFYYSAPNKIGGKLLQCLHNAMMERKITPMEAYHLAGVKGDTFAKLTAGVIS